MREMTAAAAEDAELAADYRAAHEAYLASGTPSPLGTTSARAGCRTGSSACTCWSRTRWRRARAKPLRRRGGGHVGRVVARRRPPCVTAGRVGRRPGQGLRHRRCRPGACLAAASPSARSSGPGSGSPERRRDLGRRVPQQQAALQAQRQQPAIRRARARSRPRSSARSSRHARGRTSWSAPAAASSSASTAATAPGSRVTARSTSSAVTLPEPSQIELSGASR